MLEQSGGHINRYKKLLLFAAGVKKGFMLTCQPLPSSTYNSTPEKQKTKNMASAVTVDLNHILWGQWSLDPESHWQNDDVVDALYYCLVAAGPDALVALNKETAFAIYPVHIAASISSVPILRLLIDAGADPEQ